MKILFSGGGTLGPVTPLLAIHDMVTEAHPNATFFWIGTKRGPEKMTIEEYGIPFHTISSGKLRRYISFWNVIDIVRIVIGFFQSIKILWREKPDVCISAGGFVSVPVHAAAWLLGIPTWVHQQDVVIGLANKLMAPSARVITTALEMHLNYFSKKKTTWIGNPVRASLFHGTRAGAEKLFGIDPKLPVVFATGGGTGSFRVNQLVIEAVHHLQGICHIIHLTGKERPQELIEPAKRQFSFYHPFLFFTEEMSDAYAAADIVISRGGFGTMSEIAALEKPGILIPKPGHQEENVAFLSEKNAVVVLDEKTCNGNHLAKVIKELLADSAERGRLAQRLTHLLPRAKKDDLLEVLRKCI
ncbi:MAG: UDP-N-acetylglucosamine--N-acetylmuramyl-(pentapeptide) pyrophosphoryl-undecaprenol N-acetylglucosamine transferase [Candidatus Magasanikbacteria bacterium]|jgi:UDP-N-acetylglucosamine--N-acetylmuramyl-(pentapeptide) pyrophosphoryl-undecaprenol N-acetylglucosamine transferase|nr:UDP-N-acetylglucosamine--N-acetylmuramyl-(pentapeptide) pyrophosphoryl-undecaprenol N-acetylglucosamine transferase [Candidatus Magasanikbacteria bacterium]